MSNNINGTITNYNNITGNIANNNKVSGNISNNKDMSGNIMYTILKGLSAYEVAVENGYTGTEEEWLLSLVGNGIASVSISNDGYLSLTFTKGGSYTTPISIKGKDGHSPYIGQNGNWWEWDDGTDRYVDSGYSSAIVLGRGLVRNPQTGVISVAYDDIEDLPSIETVKLVGNKTFPQLGISPIDTDDIIEITT